MTLTLVGGHEHDWRRYILREVGDETETVFTQMAFEDVPGAFYNGYRCESCGADGYDC